MFQNFYKCTIWELNPSPFGSEPNALSTELIVQKCLMVKKSNKQHIFNCTFKNVICQHYRKFLRNGPKSFIIKSTSSKNRFICINLIKNIFKNKFIYTYYTIFLSKVNTHLNYIWQLYHITNVFL